MTDRTEAALLSEAWDRLLLGDPDPADPALAPSLVETLRLLHALHAPAQPDAAFKARLRREVMGQPAAPGGRSAAPATEPRPWAAADRWRAASWPVRDALPALAAAALVLALVGGLLGMQRGLLRPGPDDSGRTVAIAPTDPAATPAAIAPATAPGTPVAVAAPVGVQRETLVSGRLTNVPASANCLVADRTTLGRDASASMGSLDTDYRGPLVYRVEAGRVVAIADGETTLSPTGGAPTGVPANQAVTMLSGDVLSAPTDAVTHWENASSGARILVAGVVEPSGAYLATEAGSGNVGLVFACDQPGLPQLGSAPLDLTVEQLTLAPGARLPRPLLAGLAPISVDDGTLTLVWSARSDPGTPLPQVGPRQLVAGTATVELNGPRYVATELRNDSDLPVSVVLMTVRPAAVPPIAAAPVASSTAAQRDLLRARLDVPENASWLGYEEWTVPAGAVWDQGSPADSGVGPMVARVESGTVVVRGEGPLEVTMAGTNLTRVSAAGTTVLGAGDTLRVPAGVVTHWRNDGAAAARLATLGATTIGEGKFGEIVSFSLAEVLSAGGLNGHTADLALREVTLAPGAAFAPEPVTGVAKIVVQSGAVTVDWAKRSAPDTVTGSLRVDPQSAAVDIESANYVAKTLRNDGPDPAEVLLLTAQPAAVTDTAPVPAATPDATPAAAAATEVTLFRQRLDDIPETAGCPIVEREVLPPGGKMRMGTKESFYLGPMAFRVESGTFTVVSEGATTLTRAGTSESIAVAPGTTLQLRPDDVLFAPTGIVTDWRNDGELDAILIDTGVVDPFGEEGYPNDDIQTELVNGCTMFSPKDFGSTSADLTVRRVTLAPGGVLASPPSRGRGYLGVEAGKVTLDWARPEASEKTTGTIALPAGTKLAVGEPNVFARQFRNEGTEPATFLIMTLDPVPAAATPAAGG